MGFCHILVDATCCCAGCGGGQLCDLARHRTQRHAVESFVRSKSEAIIGQRCQIFVVDMECSYGQANRYFWSAAGDVSVAHHFEFFIFLLY